MLRAHLTDQKRCYDHPHRVVLTACARCKTPFCDECLATRTDGVFAAVVARDEKQPPPLFCRRCVEELEVLNQAEAARRRPLWQRLRPTRAALRRAAIYLAVISVLMVPMALAVRNMASTTLTPEEMARIKIGLLGTFETPEGTNFLSTVRGGTFIRGSAPARPDHDGKRLIDTYAAVEVPGWRSADASLPQDLVFSLPSTLPLNKAILRPQPTEPVETWVRDFELLVSTESADAGFTSIGRWTLDVEQARKSVDPQRPEPQRFEFPQVPARYVMLRVLSNNGSRDYTSLGELEVYWVRKQ